MVIADKRTTIISLSMLVAMLCTVSTSALGTQHVETFHQRVPIVGGPCEGCEAVFQGLPDELSWIARIGSPDEQGEPMQIEGTVYDSSGRVAENVIVYAYHTDAHGVYPTDERLRGRAAYRHGRLRGWAQTDDRGRYQFQTIRPASYPDQETPAHVHMHVIEVGRCTYYIDSIHFRDDPRLSPEARERSEGARGGSGMVRPTRGANGVWIVRRDIMLGEGIPRYEACDRG